MNIKHTYKSFKKVLIFLFCILSFSWGMTLLKFTDIIDFKWYLISAIILFPIWGYLIIKK